MLKKVLMVSAACVALAGCATDKISMSSEVGGSGGASAAGFTTTSGSTGQGKSAGPVIGLVGGTLLGGIVDGLTGAGASGGTSASGGGQPVQALLTDVLGGLLGNGDSGGLLEIVSIIPSGLAGENDSLTSALLGGGSTAPSLGPIAEKLQSLPVAGGLVSTVLSDLPTVPGAGASTGSTGGPLAATISSVTTALNDIPVAGTVVGTVLGSLPGGLSTPTPSSGAADAGSGTGVLSSVPVVGTVIAGVADTTTTTLTAVTQVVAPVPVVGPVVSGVVGGLLGAH